MVREILIEILAYCIGDNEISLEYDELLKMQVINIRTITILLTHMGHYSDINMITRCRGKLRLSRLKQIDKIHAKNCVLKFC